MTEKVNKAARDTKTALCGMVRQIKEEDNLKYADLEAFGLSATSVHYILNEGGRNVSLEKILGLIDSLGYVVEWRAYLED